MSDSKNGIDGAANDALWDTILMYEQILEHAPEDVDALTELFRTCLAVGEEVRAYGYGKRMGQQALIVGDLQRARVVHDLLLPHSDADPAIQGVVAALHAATSGVDATTPAAAEAMPQTKRPPADPVSVETSSQSETAPSANDTGTAEIIALVSKILEDMPDDRESLEVLATAYLKAGDGVQAANTFSRLADVLIRDQDLAEGRAVQKKLDQLKRIVPEAGQAAERLAQFLSRAQAAAADLAAPQAKKTAASAPPPSLVIDAARRRVVLADEMELLWDLQQQEAISKAQYASVIHDLTELTSSGTITTVSALHGLWFRSFAGLEALVVQLAIKAAVPVITLGGFDLQPAAFNPLPLEYLTFQGVIPFERMGGEALVAVLNPFSQRLRTEVAAALGCPCHFYLIPPDAFDAALDVIKTRHVAVAPEA